MKLPTLFQKGSTGAAKQWTIETVGATIRTTFGRVGGTLQTTEDTVRSGKNVGKANETTAQEQAEAEARAKWEGKRKKGYVENADRAARGEDDVEGGALPMLAHRYDQRKKSLVFPAYAQPKLDGMRCVGVVSNGRATLWSRTRKPVPTAPHVAAALGKLFPKGQMIFDGELYNHELKSDFERLMHLARSSEPVAGHEDLQFHCYDLIVPGATFENRLAIRDDLFARAPRGVATRCAEAASAPLVSVETFPIQNADQLLALFADWRSRGYEGAMARNAAGLYVGKRSADLLKVKEMQDAEFTVVDVEEGRGKLQGCVGAFVCEDAEGRRFNATPAATIEQKRAWFAGPSSAWNGRPYTVQFFELTGDGVPRFPVGLRFREAE